MDANPVVAVAASHGPPIARHSWGGGNGDAHHHHQHHHHHFNLSHNQRLPPISPQPQQHHSHNHDHHQQNNHHHRSPRQPRSNAARGGGDSWFSSTPISQSPFPPEDDRMTQPTSAVSVIRIPRGAVAEAAHPQSRSQSPIGGFAAGAERHKQSHSDRSKPSKDPSSLRPGLQRVADDDDEFARNQEQASPLLVSLRVCKQCQEELLHAFDHCLSRHSHAGPNPARPRRNAGAKRGGAGGGALPEPPPDDRSHGGGGGNNGGVKDDAANPVCDAPAQRVARDRAVFFQTRARRGANPLAQRGPTFGSSKTFSGALYRATIEAKDREIRVLREKLFDHVAAENLEHTNVEKLRIALSKSMQYYSYAEEWQMHESARLQQDIRYLKAEMSSLMAFLINSEEEKRMLVLKMDDLNNVIKKKERRIAEEEAQKEELKAKLHAAYKEYLAVNETIDALKREAAHGSDDIISRNEVLQRNIDALARDFEGASKELSAAQMRCKELEFELEELIMQFNITGEAKRSSEDLNVKLTAERDALQREHTELKRAHGDVTARAARLDSELADLMTVYRTSKHDFEVRGERMNQDLANAAREKREIEGTLKAARGEIEKLSSALKTVTRAKDQLEAALKSSAAKHDAEVTKLEEKIKDLQSLRLGDERVMKRLNEQKEQLMFQVTDLQNNLDRETASVSMLTFELTQLKRTTEERTTTLEEQVEKLNAAKINLANDKRQLTDKVRVVRADLQKTEEALASLHATFDGHKAAAAATESGLRADLQALHAAHDTLTDEHAALNRKQAHLTETNVELMMTTESLKRTQTQLEDALATTRGDLAATRGEAARLEVECAAAVKERGEMKIHLDSVVSNLAELHQLLGRERAEFASETKARDETIARITSDLSEVRDEERRLRELSERLQEAVDALQIELGDTKVALEAETANKRLFEERLFEVRSGLLSEKRLRIELERVRARLGRHALARELEKMSAFKNRDRRMDALVKGMGSECARLQDVSALLPAESHLVAVDAPEIPPFPLVQSTLGRPGRHNDDDEVRPDIRVVAMSRGPRDSSYSQQW
ncbi:hypothetical protein DFJ73DRAFT_946290 [Zopfochytrium polystomum]|nr:hypothetical protein DFJ73DRAFT_946290 [Zopfochytrium polystomum]